MFGIGVPEFLIVLVIGLPFLALLIGMFVFIANVNKKKEQPQVPSYNELKVDNESLRKEVNEFRERSGEIGE